MIGKSSLGKEKRQAYQANVFGEQECGSLSSPMLALENQSLGSRVCCLGTGTKKYQENA
jgi:hypothetical protein